MKLINLELIFQSTLFMLCYAINLTQTQVINNLNKIENQQNTLQILVRQSIFHSINQEGQESLVMYNK